MASLVRWLAARGGRLAVARRLGRSFRAVSRPPLQGRLTGIALAAAGAGIGATLAFSGARAQVDGIRESYTGIEVAPVLDAWVECGKDRVETRHLRLVDCGVRCMGGLCWLPQARAYVVALYVDEEGARAYLSSAEATKTEGKGAPLPHGMRADQDTPFERDLLRPMFVKSLLLVFDQHVASSHISKGFNKAVEQRLRILRLARRQEREKQGMDPNDLISEELDESAMQQSNVVAFCNVFRDLDIQKGTQVVLTWCPDETLFTTINGKVASCLQDSALCWAIFDSFLGHQPLSPMAKQNICRSWTGKFRA